MKGVCLRLLELAQKSKDRSPEQNLAREIEELLRSEESLRSVWWEHAQKSKERNRELSLAREIEELLVRSEESLRSVWWERAQKSKERNRELSLAREIEELLRSEESLRSVWWERSSQRYIRELIRPKYFTMPLDLRSEYSQILNFEERLPGGRMIFRPQSTDNYEPNMKRNPLHDSTLKAWMLISAMMVVVGTYLSTSRFATTKGHTPDSLLITCISALFLASLCVVLHLLNHFKLKPWPQIAFSMLFGCYILISPHNVLPLLVLSIPFLLLAASGKFSGTGEA